MPRRLVVGNWKMNGSGAANATLLAGLRGVVSGLAEVAVCAPFVYLAEVREALGESPIVWGAQDCSAFESGAYTGEVSASMLAEFGCRYVLVGHSERRSYHRETDQQVADKAKAALGHGVTPIVCVGETLDERDGGRTDEVVKRQLSTVIHTLGACVGQIVVAYEPVWAIGTGRTASVAQAQAVHAVLRAQLHAAVDAQAAGMRILYGGSMKADNAPALFAARDIDGGLIGGASLKADDFNAIRAAAG